MLISFTKMHGCMNDFVIIDNRHAVLSLTADQIKLISDRHIGIGCDQLIILESSTQADCFMRIYNQDASEAGMCGNAARCVAYLIYEKCQENSIKIETISRLITTNMLKDGRIAVDMGAPKILQNDPLIIDVGNLHRVIFVEDISNPQFEHDPGINLNIAQVRSPQQISLRTWERGVGETKACGSGACATVVAASTQGLTDTKVEILQTGGTLTIEWINKGNIIMTGDANLSFRGQIEL
jgi:diaminopimelate epimerase